METKKHISKTKQWIAALVLTMLVSFCMEVILILYATFSNKGVSNNVPWTFHWVWEISALFGLYLIVKRFSISFGSFLAASFLGLLITTVIWSFVPNSLKVLKANYYGVESQITIDSHEAGRLDEQAVNDFPIQTGNLYKADDDEILEEFKEKSENYEFVGKKGFLFWQTGVAFGFDPYRIKEFNGGDTFLKHIELFFTVGPIVLVECFINGLYRSFLILLVIQVIWLLIKKEHIWWYK